MLEKQFKLKANGTDVKTEIIAGITTFMAMAYILAVNPSILSARKSKEQAEARRYCCRYRSCRRQRSSFTCRDGLQRI